jgi:tetratricopeptide (TPR) repeat protein
VSLNLKAYRLRRGMTQVDVVAEIHKRAVARGHVQPGLCPCAVSRHENGHKRPSLYYQAWYCEIYRATSVELGFCVALPNERDALDASAATLRAARTSRPPALGVGISTSRLARPADVDPEIVDRLLDLRAALVRTDSLLGPRRLLVTVSEQIALIEDYLAVAAANVRAELLAVGALYAEFASWLFDDAGQLAEGAAWSDRALGWAHAAGRADLVAYVLMRKAQQAMLVKQAGMVISLAQTARRIGPRASDRVLASAAQQEAHGHALAGDERAATAALASAYDLVADAPPADDRIGLAAHCDVGYLHAQRGSCMVRLGRPRAAVEAFDEALTCWPSDYRRERGLHLARKSCALVGAGEPSEAAATGRQALDIARATGSARTLDELHELDAALARVGTSDGEVDAFRDELSAIA